MPLQRIKLILFGTILMTAIFTLPAQSADYQSMTTEELSQIRGTLYNASQDEHNAFQEEWSKRLESMDSSERTKYSSSAPGNGKGLRDGSEAGRQTGGDGQGVGSGGNDNRGSGNSGGNGSGHGGNGRGDGSGSGGGAGHGGGKGRK